MIHLHRYTHAREVFRQDKAVEGGILLIQFSPGVSESALIDKRENIA